MGIGLDGAWMLVDGWAVCVYVDGLVGGWVDGWVNGWAAAWCIGASQLGFGRAVHASRHEGRCCHTAADCLTVNVRTRNSMRGCNMGIALYVTRWWGLGFAGAVPSPSVRSDDGA